MSAIRKAGASGHFVLGPNVSALEEEIAEYVGVAHAVGVANGTDSLLLSLRALGIGAGDEVITTPFTFFATTEVIAHTGATPVLVDIHPGTYNIDPESVEAKVTHRCRAIIPVHLFGCPADMTGINAIAEAHGLKVIEDAAQAFGAKWQGNVAGSMGDFGCFSFYPTKVLGCYGDGGMIVCKDKTMTDRLRSLRNHGATGPYLHDRAGYNSRLDEIQAALLRIKLRDIASSIAARRAVASQYDARLGAAGVGIPMQPNECEHVFNLYTVRLSDRDRVQQVLRSAGIGCSVYYPRPLHLQEVHRDLGYRRGDFPVCERASEELLSLPIFPEMEVTQIDRVCEVLVSAL